MALPPLMDRRRSRGLALVAVLTMMQAAAAGAAAFATRTLFETMDRGAALPARELGVLVAAGTVIAIARVAARQAGERIGQDYARQIRAALFENASRMSARAVARRRAGYMSLRFVGDMTAFRNWLGLGLPHLIAGSALIPAILIVLWLLDPAFALVVLPVVVVTAMLAAIGGFRLVPLHRRVRARRARIAADMAERMPLAPHLDRLGRRKTELALLERRTRSMIAAALRHRRMAESLKALPDLAGGIAAALVIWIGYRNGVGTGGVAGALAALGLLLAPLRDLGTVWNHRAAFRAASIKAEAALSRAHRNVYRSNSSLPKGPVDVTFQGVSLPSGSVLDLHLKRGESSNLAIPELDTEAVVDILLGLEAPISGKILLSGVDVQDISRGSLRRAVMRIGAVPEILQGSLRRALLMGCVPRPEDIALEEIVRDEGLGDLMERLGGLNGTVHEGGRNLTRGERVAIGLVRARILRPRLILLDPDVDRAARTRVDAYIKNRRATLIQFKVLRSQAIDPCQSSQA